MGTGKLALNFIKVLKAFCNVDFARKSLSMVPKTLSNLVSRSHGSPLSIPLKEKSLQRNSGIHSTQQRLRESDNLKLSALN